MNVDVSRPMLMLVCVLTLFLSGCSGHYAYQQGLEFDDEGRYEESVASYLEAVQENPDKLEYKVRLQKAREKAAFEAVAEAEKLAGEGRLQQAIASELSVAPE